ncbi:MAG: glycosyltransferase, partial [Bdellovibrionales bacterium]|nr:glycosyltransferase [Bdellovibrionales bacterium]
VVISNGVPLGDFSPSQDKRENRLREHSLPSHSLLIGHVGRFVPEKDHKTALCAFALLRAKNPGLHFVMIGRGVSSTNGAFVDLCRTVGFDPFSVESPLLLLDERGDLSQILPALDVLLSSSCTEGFPNVVAEAMSCGVPCVVTDVGESAYIVGDTGAVVPPSDPEACAAALTQLVEASPKSRKERGESARLRIKENFSVESFTSKTLSLYEEVLNLDEKATPSTVDT